MDTGRDREGVAHMVLLAEVHMDIVVHMDMVVALDKLEALDNCFRIQVGHKIHTLVLLQQQICRPIHSIGP
jgi:hypothetical protein